MKRYTRAGLFFVLLLSVGLPKLAQAEIPTAERDALIALYDATGGDSWTFNTNWKTDGTECTWHGVTCDVYGLTVTELSLGSNNLIGAIPAVIDNLSNLQLLNLWSNQLSTVPPELGNLSSLQELDLSYNLLSAAPTELSKLSSLQTLYLQHNQLTAVPPELGKLSSLQELYLGDNQLSTVPYELGKLSSLKRLSLGSNQLSAIPPELGNLSNLESLGLDYNQLSAIPPELGNLSKLYGLHIQSNQLTAVPAELGKLSSLRWLDLDGNQLTAVPAELGNLSILEGLDLSRNKLVGAIPGSFINLTSLTMQGISEGLSVKHNGLHTSDTSLLSFLNSKTAGGDLMATQTLDADGVVSMGVTDTSVDLAWYAVSYTQAGGYRIYLSTQADTGFILNSEIADKSTTSGSATGLSACTVYYARVHSYTLPFEDDIYMFEKGNTNEVESDGQTGNAVEFMTTGPSGCPPVITSGTGNFTKAEGLPTGSITTITALDSDGDTLTYSITAGDDEGKFAIDSASGVISIVAALDFETTTQYTLTVTVDDGTNQVNGTVTVNVTDVDENSGGGCSLRPGGEFDPLMPLMLLMAFLSVGYRLRFRQ